MYLVRGIWWVASRIPTCVKVGFRTVCGVEPPHKSASEFDIRGSVHHSTIHKEKNPKRCNNVSKFYYSIFISSPTCFGRHTAHYREPKTALAASNFSHVEGCWTCRWWTLSGTMCWQRPPTTRIEEEPPMWRVAANVLNKQSQTTNKGSSSSWVLGEVLTTPPQRKKLPFYETFTIS